jgi:hypothetical protein
MIMKCRGKDTSGTAADSRTLNQRWFGCQGRTKTTWLMKPKWLSPNPNERRSRAESVIQHRDNHDPHDDVPQCDGWQYLPPGFQKQPPSHRPSVAGETQDRAPFAIRENKIRLC